MKLWQDLPPAYYHISNCHTRHIFQDISFMKERETAYQYRKPFLFLIRLSCNVLVYLLGVICMFLHCGLYFLTVIFNKSSLSGVWEGDPHNTFSRAFAHDNLPQLKNTLTVWLWSEFFCCCSTSLLDLRAQGLLLVQLSFERQFYTVFSSSLQKLQALTGLTKDIAVWQKLTFMTLLRLFSKASVNCKAVLYTTASGWTILIFWSIFHQGAPNRVLNIFFSFLDLVSYMWCIYICIYTQIILHTKKRGAHEFTTDMPTI